MPRIEFRPSGRYADVAQGTELGDAALQAGSTVEMPCGGKGTCGKCLVHVLEGTAETDPASDLPEEAKASGFILACRSRAGSSDLVLEVPDPQNRAGDRYEDRAEYDEFITGVLEGGNPDPLCREIPLGVPEPRLDDGLSDIERILRALKGGFDPSSLTIALPALRDLPSALRAEGGRIGLSVCGGEESSPQVIVRVKSGAGGPACGLAIDIGTTTVAVQILDLVSGKIVSTLTGYNDQISCGLDVISRINYARTPERRNDLREKILGTLNRMIARSIRDQGMDPHEITSAVISGNTVMLHLLLGIDPEYIRLEPYTPAFLELPSISAGESGLSINPAARLYFSPCVGSYVGGDITAGILCTGLVSEGEGTGLFIDIGTNGEIVLGNRDFLMTCACSAGPAFEGGGIDHGMRATAGAIDRVTVDPATGIPALSVIGGEKPRGICGSGMIDLLAELFIHGWLDSSGKLSRSGNCSRIRVEGRRALYVLCGAGESAHGREITVSEVDIDNIMRAKAAIYSACSLILGHAGLEFPDLNRIYIAGGFGKYLNIDRAITLGLLPEVSPDTFQYVGNASLKGGAAVLLSRKLRQLQKETAHRMTYINLSSEAGYMDQYTAALFLPHTEFGRFPGVTRKMKKS